MFVLVSADSIATILEGFLVKIFTPAQEGFPTLFRSFKKVNCANESGNYRQQGKDNVGPIRPADPEPVISVQQIVSGGDLESGIVQFGLRRCRCARGVFDQAANVDFPGSQLMGGLSRHGRIFQHKSFRPQVQISSLAKQFREDFSWHWPFFWHMSGLAKAVHLFVPRFLMGATLSVVLATSASASPNSGATRTVGLVDSLQTKMRPSYLFPSSGPTVPGNSACLRLGGQAAAPANAPLAVKRAIWAANQLRTKPYRWGGGHKSFADTAYDCSGTVSYALGAAGLIPSPMSSSDFRRFGQGGRGKWITVYARNGHTYAIIAGLRLDTTPYITAHDRWAPRWQSTVRVPALGFEARHPVGL